jgi:hypothetical protein
MVDPTFNTPKTVAESDFTTRGALFCGAGCTNVALDLNTGDYAVPNRTLQCTTTRPMVPLIGFVPYPDVITSVAYYRFEWQVEPTP